MVILMLQVYTKFGTKDSRPEDLRVVSKKIPTFLTLYYILKVGETTIEILQFLFVLFAQISNMFALSLNIYWKNTDLSLEGSEGN